MNSMDQDVQRIVDVAAIKDVHLRYCRGIDRLDWDLIRSCYHPDAVDDHGAFRGGVDEFIEWSAERLTLYASTWHFTGNQFVEVEGDTAWMESSVQAYHRTSPADDAPAVDVILHLRYVDVLERRLGQWRILDRTLVFDSAATVPVGSALRPEWPASTRGRTDASYAAALVAKQRAGGGSQRLQVWGTAAGVGDRLG